MPAPRRLVLIDKKTNIKVWEHTFFVPLVSLDIHGILNVFGILLSTVPHADLVSGRLYFYWERF